MNKVVITGLVFGFIGAQRTWSQSVAPIGGTFVPLFTLLLRTLVGGGFGYVCDRFVGRRKQS